MLDSGVSFRSPGGSFAYVVVGPCCRLYDREELPWPSCSMVWRGKQPSWNRVGRRFVGDIAVKRSPSYAVIGTDRWGNHWHDVVTDFSYPLQMAVKRWWYSNIPPADHPYPEYPQ